MKISELREHLSKPHDGKNISKSDIEIEDKRKSSDIKGQFFSERECHDSPLPIRPNKIGILNFLFEFLTFF